MFDVKTDVGPSRELPAEAYRRFHADTRAQRTRNLARRTEEMALNKARKQVIEE